MSTCNEILGNISKKGERSVWLLLSKFKWDPLHLFLAVNLRGKCTVCT